MLTGYHKGQYRYIKDFVAKRTVLQKQIMSHHLTHDFHGTKENVCILLNSLPLNALNVK